MEYLDFELEIQSGSGRDYPVVVLHSPAGEARATMHFPFDQIALESRLDKLQIALLRSGGRRRRILSAEERAVQEFGQTLFDALFTGEIRTRYDVSREHAEGEGRGLRLKLRIQVPELTALPWELLYDPRSADFLVLSRNTPLVRYVELPRSIRALQVAPPLRILGLVASPKNLDDLDVAGERDRVERAVAGLRARGMVDLEWLESQTWRDLQGAMRGGPWHVLHFVGHGGFDVNADEGVIALTGEDGCADYFHASQFGRLLADHRSLRLVLLNACETARSGNRDVFSSTASILMQRGIPAVLAMQYEITDRAAIEFARAFYEALADGSAIDGAVSEARKAISLKAASAVEWCTPVLHMRTPDGILFDLAASSDPHTDIDRHVGLLSPSPVVRPHGVGSLPILSTGKESSVVLLFKDEHERPILRKRFSVNTTLGEIRKCNPIKGGDLWVELLFDDIPRLDRVELLGYGRTRGLHLKFSMGLDDLVWRIKDWKGKQHGDEKEDKRWHRLVNLVEDGLWERSSRLLETVRAEAMAVNWGGPDALYTSAALEILYYVDSSFGYINFQRRLTSRNESDGETVARIRDQANALSVIVEEIALVALKVIDGPDSS